MKILNKKGFVLVETLIVTAFVMTLFIVVYQTVIPFIGEYEKLSNYDDIDSIYASNLVKQLITRYANTDYIDDELNKNTYLNINNCEDTNLYINKNYCEKVYENLEISQNDYVYLTKYNISEFRETVNTDEKFDSGNLSNFRNYIDTVSDIESFYNEDDEEELIGKYRLFIIRNINEADKSTTLKYVNIGIYMGAYKTYTMGQAVTFDPIDGSGNNNMTFYVLKNSTSSDENITLILEKNLENSYTAFNSINTVGAPNTVLEKLKEGTDSWANVEPLTDYIYSHPDKYSIDYTGYRARLIDENDIIEALGCKENTTMCFNYAEAFAVEFDKDKLIWLIANLKVLENPTSEKPLGYWTSATIHGSGSQAWSIQRGKVVPTLISENSTIGVRPVITIPKSKLEQE